MGQQEVLDIINKLKPKEEITAKEIAIKIGYSDITVAASLKKLRDQQEVNYKRVKMGKYIYWKKEHGK